MKVFVGLLVLVVVFAGGWMLLRPKEAEAPVYKVGLEDADMDKAMAEAIASFAVFQQAFDAQAADDEGFIVKANFAQNGQRPMYFWADYLGREGETVKTRWRLAEPTPTGLAIGQEVDLHISRVADWGFKRDGKGFGMFTERVLRARSGGDTSIFHETPLPAEKTA